jgi:hypothetical protein
MEVRGLQAFYFKVNVQGWEFLRQKDIDGSQGMFFMSIRILIELLLIVKRTPLPLLKFFFCGEKIY